MKRVILVIVIISLFTGCSKDDDTGFTSLIGLWTYTTPDEKIKVEFDVVGGDKDILNVINQKIYVEDEEGMANVEIESVAETSFGRIRINANDTDLVYPYDIVFTNLVASADFSMIEVETVTYIFPWGKSNELSNVKIERR